LKGLELLFKELKLLQLQYPFQLFSSLWIKTGLYCSFSLYKVEVDKRESDLGITIKIPLKITNAQILLSPTSNL